MHEPSDWRNYLVPGDDQYIPQPILPQMSDIVARAIASGAPIPLEFMGAGMTGVVFCAGDVAYKVARATKPINHSFFEDEAEWLAAAARVSDVAPHVARIYRFDPDNLVIERECPKSDRSTYSYGESKLFDLHQEIGHAMIPHGWSAPEFKPDSYIITARGPILVDASMPSRVGEELVRYVEAAVSGERQLWNTRPSDLAFAVRSEVGRTISKGESDRLEDLIEQRWSSQTTSETTRKRTGKAFLRELRESDPLATLVIETSIRYPKSGNHVDGLFVRPHVPNLDSIDGYFASSKTIPGVRVVPMSDLGGPRSVFYAADDFERSERLAEAIRVSGEINPLIIGVDDKGAFIIEGAHRFVALWNLKAKEFPAVVVVGEE